jgi:hypothetical protein
MTIHRMIGLAVVALGSVLTLVSTPLPAVGHDTPHIPAPTVPWHADAREADVATLRMLIASAGKGNLPDDGGIITVGK